MRCYMLRGERHDMRRDRRRTARRCYRLRGWEEGANTQKACFYADAESTGASHTGEMPTKRDSALRLRRAGAVV